MSRDESVRRRVVLVGLGPTASSALAGLANDFDVIGLVRADDDDVCQHAKALGAEISSETTVEQVEAFIERLAPDVVVVSSYHRILPERMLRSRPYVNTHYAPLPRYRGRATVNWAIINGDDQASITIHTLVPGLDEGGILYQDYTPLTARDTVASVYERLNSLQRDALAEAVTRRLSGDLGQPQDERAATYGCTRVPDDGEVAWTDPTDRIDRVIRALTPPFPGAYTYLGLRRLWIRDAAPRRPAPTFEGRVPGRVVGRSGSEGWVDVLTGDGILRLRRLQTDDGPSTPAAAVIRSVKQTLGLRTGDLLARIAELEALIRAATALSPGQAGRTE